MTSWKTTLCGVIGAIGTYLITLTDPAWMATVGKILVGLSVAGLGFFAKDSNVTGGTKQQ